MTDFKRDIKEDTVFVREAKTHILNVLREQNLLKDDKCCIQFKTEKI